MKEFNFYIDDSGTRNPDKKRTATSPVGDWFALGGVLISADDEARAREMHAAFCNRWGINDPLHSIKIRYRSGAFAWLGKAEPADVERFFQELDALVAGMPIYALACVIDRPGYNTRYSERFGSAKWSLCKTAFAIIAERAAKFAIHQDARIRLYVERSDRESEKLIQNHYNELRKDGMPFAPGSSAKYAPLNASTMKSRLYDLKFKSKTSPILQMADLLLYPLCKVAYEPQYRPMILLREEGRLLEDLLPSELHITVGTKYSCFDAASLTTAG